MSKHYSLTAERLRELLSYDPETGSFNRKKKRGGSPAGSTVGYPDKDGYICSTVDNKSYKVHRLAWLYVYGVWPKNEIDHINGVKDDNRIENLRDINRQANCQNRTKVISTSGLLGVTRRRKRSETEQDRWSARIRVNGRNRYLGDFKSPEDAHKAYIEAKRQHHVGCVM